MRQGRRCASRLLAMRPARSNTLRWLGDGGAAHLEGLGDLGDRGLAKREPREDSAAGRIGEGGEGGAELVAGHLYITIWLDNHSVQYSASIVESSPTCRCIDSRALPTEF